MIPSVSPSETKDYYVTTKGKVCPSEGMITTASECSKAYKIARNTWTPTNLNGRQGADYLDMHKNDAGWSGYPVCKSQCLLGMSSFVRLSVHLLNF